jgi:hypothetical protein
MTVLPLQDIVPCAVAEAGTQGITFVDESSTSGSITVRRNCVVNRYLAS